MRKYTAFFITLIAALFLIPAGLTAQAGRGATSDIAGIGLNGYIEQTDFDSLHVVTGGLYINDVQVTSTGTELNVLDGIAATLTYGELDILDGVTATYDKLNYLDIETLGTGLASKAVVLDTGDDYTWPATGIFTYAVLNDGTTALSATALELNVLAGVTAGTRSVSKAIVVDGSGTIDALDITTLSIGTVAVTATAADLNAIPTTTSTAAELNYLDLGVLGTGAASKAVVLDTGEDYIWPSGGVLTYGGSAVTSTGDELSYTDITTLGTQEASKCVTTDVNSNSGISQVTELWIGATGSEVQVVAMPAEIDRVADLSTSIVSLSANAAESITLAAHGNRTILLNRAAGITITLPAATGTGATYTFIVGTGCTSNDYIIKVADGTDVFDGGLAFGVDVDGEGATGYTWYAVAGDDTFTMPNAGPVSGGEVGDMIKVIDYATDYWYLEAHIQQGGGAEVTPFSSGV